MNYLKRFNEIVGFDDEETRYRLEIPNLKGELDTNSPDMKTFYHPTNKVDTNTEVKKIIFRYPILDRFLKNSKLIEGSRLQSFYATSKVPIGGNEFYSQLSFAFHEGKYYLGTVLREREDLDEINWVQHHISSEKIEDVFEMTNAFIEACKRLGILDSSDLNPYNQLFN
jgi:hypothetical protein